MNLFHFRGVPAGLIAILFAVVARVMGSVTDGGAIAGLAVAFVLMVAAGFAGFMPLLTLFLLTVLSTRWGRRRKERLGVAERSGGRDGRQVLANLGAVTCCALAALWFPEFGDVLLAGAMSAIAEAAADTVSSEVGQASGRSAYLIVGFSNVPIGTNGAVSFAGTMAGCFAACVIAWVSGVFGVVSWFWTPIIAIAGAAGMMIDSLLGATLENSSRMGNDSVNFVSTVCAADLALITGLVLQRISSPVP
jgi:uncharacterized protein (TIGR00297 family)